VILEVESSFESATLLGAVFRLNKYVYPYFKKRPYVINLLSGSETIPYNFRNELNDKEISFVSGFDHGSYTVFFGHDYSHLWDSGAGIQESEVKGRVVHLLACQTAKELGVELVRKGAKAYFGYDENFRFWSHEDYADDMLNDPYADPFFKADSEIDRCLADGMAADQVHKKVDALFNDLIDEWTGVNDMIASRLNWDLIHFCSPTKDEKWGRKDAVIDDAIRVFMLFFQ